MHAYVRRASINPTILQPSHPSNGPADTQFSTADYLSGYLLHYLVFLIYHKVVGDKLVEPNVYYRVVDAY